MSTAVRGERPSRAEIEPAALELVRRHGAQIMATARRYAATPEDAEDAYQRGLEILLTKAPTTSADDLVPWLKTVVKHEAFALRKQRDRAGVPTAHDDSTPAATDTHEHVERLDRLQRGAEAMQRLKPQEVRCLLLLAEGHSYAEICAITGFSYTKVNRCLAEGRQAFLQRVDGIESGAECARLAPLVSAAADGEASAEDMLVVRRHMRSCLACRAALRDARAVPARVAALAPGVALAPHGGSHAALSWLHDKLTAMVLRGQDAIELAAAHKTVAVAASVAALAGGGVAVHGVDRHAQRPPVTKHAEPPLAARAVRASVPVRAIARRPRHRALRLTRPAPVAVAAPPRASMPARHAARPHVQAPPAHDPAPAAAPPPTAAPKGEATGEFAP